LPLSAPDAIHPAFDHAKAQLLHPFRFTQWIRLAFVGLLAGELSSGGCNANFPMSNVHKGTTHVGPHVGLAALPAELTQHPVMFVALIALAAVVGFGVAIVFTYINCVMRFILFDSVVAKECHIRRGWRRRAGNGLRLFWWQLAFSLVILAAMGIVIGIPAAVVWRLGWFAQPREHFLGLALGGFGLFLLVFVLVMAFAVVQVMTKDFVVPQMALENIGAAEGWRRLWLRIKMEKSGYAGYIGMKIVLSLAAAIIFGIITVIVLLVLLVPIGGAGLVAVLGGKAAGLTWNVFTIALAAMAGGIALAWLIFVAAMISVPAIVFFPAYAIYFFAPRYPPLADLLWPGPPVSIPPILPQP
jgi:hypothetical protein